MYPIYEYAIIKTLETGKVGGKIIANLRYISDNEIEVIEELTELLYKLKEESTKIGLLIY